MFVAYGHKPCSTFSSCKSLAAPDEDQRKLTYIEVSVFLSERIQKRSILWRHKFAPVIIQWCGQFMQLSQQFLLFF